jgi:membrane protein implicated in regulation of membrane protease activity
MIWWYWVVFGLLLAGFEILTPGGFFLLFFGVAAILVGVLAGLELGGPLWMQWFLFSALSVVCVLFFRNPLVRYMQQGAADASSIDSLRGEVAVAMDGIAVGAMGRAQLRGTVWSARNGGDTPIAPGDRCTVDAVDGLTIRIRREGAH